MLKLNCEKNLVVFVKLTQKCVSLSFSFLILLVRIRAYSFTAYMRKFLLNIPKCYSNCQNILLLKIITKISLNSQFGQNYPP